MKINARTERYFDITDLSESKVKVIHTALTCMVHKIAELDSETQDIAIELMSMFKEILKPEPVLAPQPLTTNPYAGQIMTQELLTKYIMRLRPFGRLMVPKTFAPEGLMKPDGISQFMLGTKGQLNISYWEDENDYDDGVEATSKIWLNKECVHLLYNFISSKGEQSGIHKAIKMGFDIILKGYLDNTGRNSQEKEIKLVYNTSLKTVSITKDDNFVQLFNFETICLVDFIGYHLGVNL